VKRIDNFGIGGDCHELKFTAGLGIPEINMKGGKQ